MPAFGFLGEPAITALQNWLLTNTDTEVEIHLPPHANGGLKYTVQGNSKFLDPDGYPATTPPWGTLSAINLDTGKYVWKIPLGEYPELVAKGMKDTGTENHGGAVVTAGGGRDRPSGALFIAFALPEHVSQTAGDRALTTSNH